MTDKLDEARMSAAVKLQRAFEREQQKSAASRARGQALLDKAKQDAAKKEEPKKVEEHIVKVSGGYELKSKKTGRNLGKYPTKAGAEKRERQVQYFKHVNEAEEKKKKPEAVEPPPTPVHQIGVIVSQPEHPMEKHRDKQIQKFLRVATKSQKDAMRRAKQHFEYGGFIVHDMYHHSMVEETEMEEAYNHHDNRTGFGKRRREDDEYHVPDPVTRTHKIVHTVSKDGGEKHNREVTISNTTKTREEAKAAARAHLEKQGYKIHEEVDLDESMTDSWKKIQSMDKGSVTGGKEQVKKRLAYLNAVHAHHKTFGNDTKKVKSEIERINRARIAEEQETQENTMDLKTVATLLKKQQSIDETYAKVETHKYSWGTMKTAHHGASFSVPMHPEHHRAIHALKDNQEHKFKDETGRHWTAKRQGDDVHLHSANNGPKTKIKHSDLKEEIEQIEERNKENATKRKMMDASRGARYKTAGNPVPDRGAEHKTAQAHNKAIGRALRNEETEEEVELDEKLNMKTASMKTVIDDFADSNAPQFRGKSGEKRRQMAIAAKLKGERTVKEEDLKLNSFKSYLEEDLDEAAWPGTPEYKAKYGSTSRGKVGSQTHGAKGTQTVTATGVKHERNYEKAEKETGETEKQEKRGRGRPKGSASGARQKGSAAKGDNSKADYTGFKLHLPSRN